MILDFFILLSPTLALGTFLLLRGARRPGDAGDLAYADDDAPERRSEAPPLVRSEPAMAEERRAAIDGLSPDGPQAPTARQEPRLNGTRPQASHETFYIDFAQEPSDKP